MSKKDYEKKLHKKMKKLMLNILSSEMEDLVKSQK